MIKKLIIRNFQSHKHTELLFSPGVNIITGKSNSGKTAILRAIKWIVRNRPTGYNFRSYFLKDHKDNTSVTLFIDDHKVIRERGDTVNRYILDDNVFTAFGNDIPEEVSKVINFGDLNIQEQFDSHFLLSNSPGEIGKTINRIVRLENIDILTSHFNNLVNRLAKQVDTKKEEIEQIKASLEKYKDLKDIEKRVNEIKRIRISIEEKTKKIKKLADYILELEECDNILSKENRYIAIDRSINRMQKLIERLNTTYAVSDRLIHIIEPLRILVDMENSLMTKIEKRTMKLNKLIELHEIKEKLDSRIEKLTEIKSLISKWNDLYKKGKAIEESLQDKINKFNDYITEYGCPFCGRVNICPHCGEKLNATNNR